VFCHLPLSSVVVCGLVNVRVSIGTNLIWWTAIALEVMLLCRGVYGGLLRRYPFFYIYIACILATEMLRLFCYQFAPAHYAGFFWNTEVLTVAASYGVIVEIFRASLKRHPGIARLVQRVLLVVFVIALSYAATDLLHGGWASMPRAAAELGRDLRYVEGAVLLVMLWFFGRYRIALGRNLLGLAVGYSFWVGLNVMNLALFFIRGNEASSELKKLLPLTYLATLIVWCITLWSSQPEPAEPTTDELGHEYEILAQKTRLILARTSTRLVRTIRP
jgi:hypothetical protein